MLRSRFISDSERRPSARVHFPEAQTLTYLNTMLTEEMCYCPLDIQEQLPLDEENKQIQARLVEEELARWLSSSLSPDDDHNPQRRGKDGFTYEISQSDGSDVVTIHYDTNHDVRVTALISNGLGYIYRRAPSTVPVSAMANTSSTSMWTAINTPKR